MWRRRRRSLLMFTSTPRFHPILIRSSERRGSNVAIGVVPVIYNHASKKILRWYVLDREDQLNDPAFKPQNNSEKIIRIPLPIYKILAGGDARKPLLHKLQEYINGNAP